MSSNKRARLQSILDTQAPDLIIGTETKLDCSITDQEVFPPPYKVFRKDRSRGGGGVLIAYNSTTIQNITEIITDSPCEIIWARVAAIYNKSLIFGSFYRPPNSPITALDSLQLSLQNIYANKSQSTPVYLCGDFNLKDISWESLSVCPGATHVNFLLSSLTFQLIFL